MDPAKKNNKVFAHWIIPAVALAFWISGCQSQPPPPTPTELPYFLAPTAGAPVNPSNQIENISTSTPRPDCTNKLRFEDDLTIPDGTTVEPGEKVIKRWLVTNTGSCNWNTEYNMQLISGLRLGASETHLLYPARRGSRAALEITFTAPDNPGRYNSWWQAYDPSGQRFGDPFYMDIIVENRSSE